MEAQPTIEVVAGGASATNGAHSVFFPDGLGGVLELTTPEGLRLRSRVYGLSYFDAAGSGKAVLLAEATDAGGLLVGDHEVLYTNVFDGAGAVADVQYLNQKAGLEQNVVLRAQLPSPSEFGLNPATTRLQVLTEFFDPPAPV